MLKKLLILSSCVCFAVSALLYSGCTFSGGDDSAQTSASDSGFIRDNVILNSPVNVTLTDPELYESYLDQDFSEMIKRVKQSVVAINVTTESGSKSFGSGIVVANSHDFKFTYIATSHTLIKNAKTVSVELYGESNLFAHNVVPVGTDPQTDVCVIRVDGNLPPAVFFNSEYGVPEGIDVLSVANVLGEQSNVVTGGIVSLSEYTVDVGEGNSTDYILTDAIAASQNALGGGLFTEEGGFLVGMICNVNSGIRNYAYALDCFDLVEVCSAIIENGYVEGRYKLGISAADNRTSWGVTESVSVTEVLFDGCMYAEGNGLRIGDVIKALGYQGTNYAITRTDELYFYLYDLDFEIGDKLIFSIERNGTLTTVEITIKQYDYFNYVADR